jgi:hypothetical protein
MIVFKQSSNRQGLINSYFELFQELGYLHLFIDVFTLIYFHYTACLVWVKELSVFFNMYLDTHFLYIEWWNYICRLYFEDKRNQVY